MNAKVRHAVAWALEILGLVCLVVAAFSVSLWLAVAVLGVVLVVAATVMDRSRP